MDKKNFQIFSINKKEAEQPAVFPEKELFELGKLIVDEKFNEVISRTKKYKKLYPDAPLLYTIDALAHSSIGKSDIALKILLNAKKKFPNESEIYYQIGEVYQELEDYHESNIAFKKFYDLTPIKDNTSRFECLYEIGNNYWEMNEKDEAEKYWELAIKENPKNVEAKNYFNNLFNKFGFPLSFASETDDLFYFQELQQNKFFNSGIKTNLSKNEEAKNIVGLIMEKWKEVIIPQKDKLNSMSLKEKTEWFNSIEIDFNKQSLFQFTFEFDDELDYLDVEQTIFDGFNEEEILIIPFTYPFFKAAGIYDVRIDTLFKGKAEPIDYELDLLEWALLIVEILFEVEFVKAPIKKKNELIEEAIEIAEEQLESEIAESVVYDVLNLIKNFIPVKKKPRKKKKSKKNKR